jgi:hypothetical protein
MLILADRGYSSFDLWQQYLVTGAALVWRVRAGFKLPVAERRYVSSSHATCSVRIQPCELWPGVGSTMPHPPVGHAIG